MKRYAAFSIVAAAGLVLGGCVATRYQISDALMGYGLSRGEADCAAEFLRGKLSTRQVDRLARAAHDYRRNGPMTFADLLGVAGSLRDGETVMQVGAAALACRLGGRLTLPRL